MGLTALSRHDGGRGGWIRAEAGHGRRGVPLRGAWSRAVARKPPEPVLFAVEP